MSKKVSSYRGYPMKLRQIFSIPFLRSAWNGFIEDKCSNLGAALSYYTLFSLAPLLITLISITGFFFGREAVSGRLFDQIGRLIGPEGAHSLQHIIQKTYYPGGNGWAALIGAGFLLAGATGVFVQLQDALDTIWRVKPKPQKNLMRMVHDRILSFGMILGVGFLLLVSLAFNAAITAMSGYLSDAFSGLSAALLAALEVCVSLAMTSVLFGMMFKFLPDVKLRWKDVEVGAVTTAVLFMIGRTLIGFYLGRSRIVSAYGAAATVVVIILWIYYSSMIFFFGAELTKEHVRRTLAHIEPSEYAVAVVKSEKELADARESLTPPLGPGRRPREPFTLGKAVSALCLLVAVEKYFKRRQRRWRSA